MLKGIQLKTMSNDTKNNKIVRFSEQSVLFSDPLKIRLSEQRLKVLKRSYSNKILDYIDIRSFFFNEQ